MKYLMHNNKLKGLSGWVITLLFMLFIGFALLALYQAYQFNFNDNRLLESALDTIEYQDKAAADNIADNFYSIQMQVDNLVRALDKQPRQNPQVIERLKPILSSGLQVFETGVVYHKANPNQGVLPSDAPHYGFINDHIKEFSLDYPYWQSPWFMNTTQLLTQGGRGAHWYEPYYGKTTGKLVVGYGAPFRHFSNGKEVTGMARANLSLKGVQNYLSKLNVGEGGYTIMLSAQGRFIVHPQARLLGQVIDDPALYTSVAQSRFYQNLKKSLAGRSGGGRLLGMRDPISNAKASLVYVPVGETGMVLCSIILNDQLRKQLHKDEYRRNFNLIFFICLSLLCLVIALGWLLSIKLNIDLAWKTSFAASLVLVVTLIGLGGLAYEGVDPGDMPMVNSHHNLASELDRVKARYKNEIFSTLATGVFIQSLEFKSANNVYITGYIWQHYKDGEDTPGIIFPESVGRSIFKPVYTLDHTLLNRPQETSGHVVKGWYFETTFRQPFAFSHYPLDRKYVWIRLWHGDMTQKTLLMPDLSAYDFLAENLLPGLEESMVLAGWKKEGSGFFYKNNHYNTNFGMGRDNTFSDLPELYYVIKLKRTFMEAFIISLVPLIVVAIMLFSMLMTIGNDDSNRQRLGSNPFSIVTASSGLFFVILISHIQVREEFPVPNLIYIEYYYLVMYLAILWVSISSFHIALSKKGDLFYFRQGIVVKLLYWPLILLLLTLATYSVFIAV